MALSTTTDLIHGLNEMTNAQFETPEFRHLLSLPITPARARCYVWEMPHLPKKPSQIFKESPIFVSLEAEEGLLPETVAYVGDDHFLYASDIPHWDMGFPNNLNDLRDHPRLSREAKEKILYRNAQTLFGLAQPAATATA